MTALKELIVAEIERSGPMPLDRYMALCLSHPEHGYYMSKEPFGLGGDFTTAPEISQMFGELIGLWVGDMWTRQGQPENTALVELGPGRGTLMADALRALQKVPAWTVGAPHFVETSLRLRAVQKSAHAHATWHDTLSTLPSDGPLYVVANELFDALPIKQFEKTQSGWRERAIEADRDGLAFTHLPENAESNFPQNAAVGDIIEQCPAAQLLIGDLAHRILKQGGAALIIDYGFMDAKGGDSFQAVQKHRYTDPLAAPGEADLTAHVDFRALAATATSAGCAVHGPVTQGAFLGQLGMPIRARALGGPALRDAARLMDGDAMGILFKVIAITQPDSPAPAGFTS